MTKEEIIVQLRARDSTKAIASLKSMLKSQNTTEVCDFALKAIRHSGCLIAKYAGEISDATRKSFVRAFLEFFESELGQSEVVAEFESHAKDAERISLCFGAILTTLTKTDISSRPVEVQLWASIQRACNEVKVAVATLKEQWQDQISSGNPTLSDATIAVEGLHISVDSVLDLMSSNIVNCIKMFGIRHNWVSKDGTIVIPRSVHPDDAALFESGSLLILAKTWGLLQSASEENRFHGGRTEWSDSPGNLPVPNEQRDQLPNKWLLFECDHSYVKPFLIARKRLSKMLIQMLAKLETVGDLEKRTKSPLSGAVGMPPGEVVSVDEAASISVLQDTFHWPVYETGQDYSGLSILEWIRAYSTMKLWAESLLELNASTGICSTSEDTLIEMLGLAGLSSQNAAIFIHHVTLSIDSPDLFDAPLIRDDYGALHFVYQFYDAVQVFSLVASQFGRLGHQIKSKGGRFEVALRTAFAERNITSKSFKYEINGSVFECDLCAVWGDYVLVFECKNYALPDHSPTLHYYFLERMAKAVRQAKRICLQLRSTPSILEEQFGHKITQKTFIPIVLNSMPWSIPGKSDGVYIYDTFALGRFLDDGVFRVVAPRKLKEGLNVVRRHQVHSAWTGCEPSPTDLIRELDRVSQYCMAEGDWILSELPLNLGQKLGMVMKFYSPLPESLERSLAAIGCADGIADEVDDIFKEFERFVDAARHVHDDESE